MNMKKYVRSPFLLPVLSLLSSIECGEQLPGPDELIPLQVSRVDQKFCPTTGGLTVTLTGTGLVSTTTVSVGGIPAHILPQDLSDKTATQLKFILPPLPNSQGKKQKMVVANPDPSGNTPGETFPVEDAFTCYLGSVAFSVAPDAALLSGNQPASITAGDFNNDTKLDLAVVYSDSLPQKNMNVDILSGNGKGAFTNNMLLQIQYGTDTHPQIVTDDFNADKLADLAFLDKTGTNFNVGIQVANGFNLIAVPVGKTPHFLTTADFDSDGYPDIATANTDVMNQNRMSILMNNQKTLGKPGFAMPSQLPLANDPQFLIAKDLNTDGKPDLIAVTTINSAIYGLQNAGGTSFTAIPQNPRLPAGFLGQTGVAALLFDGKQPDLAIIGTDSMYKSVVIVQNTSSASMLNLSTYGTSFNTYQAAGDPASTLATTDIDLDGFADIVISTGDRLSILLSKAREGKGVAFSDPITFLSGLPSGTSLEAIVSGDFNTDGKIDFVAIPSQGQNVLVFINTSI